MLNRQMEEQKMNQTITLNDDTTISVVWCGVSEGVLWADGLPMTLLEAMTIFSDNTKTSKITVALPETIHEGYTELIHVSTNYDGAIKVALRKEV